MEGMRHKLSLPGLGMSKCTDPSRSPALQAVLEAVCRICRETRRHRLQSLEACARSRTAETRRACRYCTGREQMSNVLSLLLLFSFVTPWRPAVRTPGSPCRL